MYQYVSASLCSQPLLPVIMSGWCISIFFAVKEISYGLNCLQCTAICKLMINGTFHAVKQLKP